MKTKKGFLIMLNCILVVNVFSQNNTKTNTVQPKIMVIPFTKEGEDIRTVLEADFNKRVAVAKVKEAFDSRGFTTVDFRAKLKSVIDGDIIKSNTQSSIKAKLLASSGADIYVEIDLPPMINGNGGLNSVQLILNGYDISTGGALSSKTCVSSPFATNDYGSLIMRALTKDKASGNETQSPCAEEFLNTLQDKFTDIVDNGRPLNIQFNLSNSSKYKFSTEIKTDDNERLSSVITNWMGNNTVKNNYHVQSVSDVEIILDEVRIPLKDINGRNFSPYDFSNLIYKFLKSKSINSSTDIKNGTIFVTIN